MSVIESEDVQRTIWVEVTNTLAVDYVTGFQRHTRELLARLPGPSSIGPIRFVPVIWCDQCDGFRRLTASEEDSLAKFERPDHVATSGVDRVADRLGPAGEPFRSLANSKTVRKVRDEIANARRKASHPEFHKALKVDVYPPNSWLFDLEAAWHNRERSYILPKMANAGVRTATLVADVMPVQFSQWFDEGQIRLFKTFIDAHIHHSEKFVAISERSRLDAIEYASTIAPYKTLDTSVITMGANFAVDLRDLPKPASAPRGRYAICVATIEPRKNHGLLIDVLEQLTEDDEDLSIVMVGKAGWMTADLIERIRNHREYGHRLRWLNNVDDDELNALFAHAFLAIQPAHYEGFGTPVIEALSHGVPTLSSNGGALVEAGAGYAEFFDPNSAAELLALIRRHLSDPEYHEAKRKALVSYRPPTWEDGAAGIVTALSK